MELFDQVEQEMAKAARPLAERMRPQTLEAFVGQTHLLGKDSLLRQAIKEDQLFSVIFWGPPGSGKTTLARIMAQETKSNFEAFSAVLSGVKEIRQVIDSATIARRHHQKRTVLFVDEIHRFNKAQQDTFLPYVEKGSIILIGATTENPSFELNSSLLSRVKVYMLNPLSFEDIKRPRWKIFPLVGLRSWLRVKRSVVFPDPFGPMIAKTSPSERVNRSISNTGWFVFR